MSEWTSLPGGAQAHQRRLPPRAVGANRGSAGVTRGAPRDGDGGRSVVGVGVGVGGGRGRCGTVRVRREHQNRGLVTVRSVGGGA